MHELLDRYGAEFVDAGRATSCIDYSERWMRAEIAAMPDGDLLVHRLDGGRRRRRRARSRCASRSTIRGDEHDRRLDRLGPQARGPINATFVVTAAAGYNAVFHVPSPTHPEQLRRLPADPTSSPRRARVVNVDHPGPSVGGNTETHPQLVDLVTRRARAGACRERVAAAEGASACNFLFGGVHPKTGDYYTNYHLEGSGWGATDYDDGNDARSCVNGNCRNTPVEIFETRYPLRTWSTRSIPDSGGAGRHRGGLGDAADHAHRARAPEVTASALFDRTKAESAPGAWWAGCPAATARSS